MLKEYFTRNVFFFNSVICEQIDGVLMGSWLGPNLSNYIMTELEIKVVESLFKDGLLKLYIYYVHDTLVLIKESDIDNVLSKLNSFSQV